MRRPAAGLEHGSHGLEGSHAEVGHLDVVLVVEQQVLGLEVAVADGVAVAKVQGGDDLWPVVGFVRSSVKFETFGIKLVTIFSQYSRNRL